MIDGNSIINRAFYGLSGSKMLTNSEGIYTNAIYGFLNIMSKYCDEEKPSHICVAFDLKAPTFRHLAYDGYKSNRKGMPDELAMQVPLLKDVLDAMNIKRIEMEGFEADDIIGSLAKFAEKSEFETVILTGDRDSFQLVSDKIRVKMPTTKAGKTETEDYTVDKLFEKYNISPNQFIELKALMGDSSDCIPGVAGVGEKTGLELIIKYKNIDNIYNSIEEISKKALKEKLTKSKEMAYLSRELATIKCDIEFNFNIQDLKKTDPNREELVKIYRKLEFKTFLDKMGEGMEEIIYKEFKNVKILDNIFDLEYMISVIKSTKYVSLYFLYEKDEITLYRGISLGLAISQDEIFFLDLRDNEQLLQSGLKEIFESNEIFKFGHDIKYFYVYLKMKSINLLGIEFDSVISTYILNPSKENYTIEEIVYDFKKERYESFSNYIGKGKSSIKLDFIDKQTIAKYIGNYAFLILYIKDEILLKLHENNQDNLFQNIEIPLISILGDIEYYGIKVDDKILMEYSKTLDKRILELESKIYEKSGEKFNINSPKQLGVVLFEKLNLPVVKKTKTGYSTDVEVLESLEDKHEVIVDLLEYRQLVKLKTTYVDGLLAVINKKTGRIHSNFNQSITVTGRLSSTEPNLQNIPIKLEMGREIRKVFIPKEGYIFVDADYSQIELRVLAHYANDENMINAFMNNIDIHTKTASEVFNVQLSDVTSIMRSRAKAVNFGIVYGIGDFSLSKDIKVSRKEAKLYIENYFKTYPNVKQYLDDVVKNARENGYVDTITNRKRYLPEITSKNFNIRSFGERVAMNAPIQGSAADIIKIAMIKVANELKAKNLESKLILQVHDELIIETKIEEKDEVIKILKENMENAVRLNLPLVSDVNIGESWYDTKR